MSQTWTDTADGNDNRPINCVNWYEAMAFCAWDGGRLPTEAEWNYVAAGGDEQRAYLWSVPPSSLDLDSSHAGYWDGTTCIGDGKPGCQTTDLVLVGSKPAGDGRWDHSDLVGNVYNWVLDWWGPYVSPCVDCANLVDTPLGPGGIPVRDVRGGGYDNTPFGLRTTYRNGYQPSVRLSDVGFRCAR